jgi:hypothetical protein
MQKFEVSRGVKRAVDQLDSSNVVAATDALVKYLSKEKTPAKRHSLIIMFQIKIADRAILSQVLKGALERTTDSKAIIDLLKAYYMLNFSDEYLNGEILQVEEKLIFLSQKIRYNVIAILYSVLDNYIYYNRTEGIEKTLKKIVSAYKKFGAKDHPVCLTRIVKFDASEISKSTILEYLEVCRHFYLSSQEIY